jgi:hypothetical protein
MQRLQMSLDKNDITNEKDNNSVLLVKLPVSNWIKEVAQGKKEYLTKPRKNKNLKKEYFRVSR